MLSRKTISDISTTLRMTADALDRLAEANDAEPMKVAMGVGTIMNELSHASSNTAQLIVGAVAARKVQP